MRRLFTKEFDFDPDKIVLCSNCSTCRWTCTSYEEFGTEAMFAGGRLRLLRSYVERNLEIDEEFMRVVHACTTCQQCVERCPIKLPYVQIIEDVRHKLVDLGIGPYGRQAHMGDMVLKYNNVFGERPETRADWIPEDGRVSDDSEWAYYVGCTASYRRPEIAQATLKMLNYFSIEPQVLGADEYCCTSPLLRTGQVRRKVYEEEEDGTTQYIGELDVERVVGHNIERMESRGIKHVIFSCSGCYRTVTLDWPSFYRVRGAILPFTTQHLTQFLAGKVKTGELKWKKGFNETVAYHDPCHLGRHVGIFEEPREILRSIPGLKLVEMDRFGNNSKCCGAGGGFKAGFGEEAMNMAARRGREALDAGATTLVSACVFCKLNFLDAVKKRDVDINVVNIEDLFIDLMELS
ncbi:MAG: (Fe-S)-binding protein [Candidatus Thorarchaeota archaeon]